MCDVNIFPHQHNIGPALPQTDPDSTSMFWPKQPPARDLSCPEEPPSDSHPIKATFLRETTTRLAVGTLGPVSHNSAFVKSLTPSICVKCDTRLDLSEAATTEFVRLQDRPDGSEQ